MFGVWCFCCFVCCCFGGGKGRDGQEVGEFDGWMLGGHLTDLLLPPLLGCERASVADWSLTRSPRVAESRNRVIFLLPSSSWSSSCLSLPPLFIVLLARSSFLSSCCPVAFRGCCGGLVSDRLIDQVQVAQSRPLRLWRAADQLARRREFFETLGKSRFRPLSAFSVDSIEPGISSTVGSLSRALDQIICISLNLHFCITIDKTTDWVSALFCLVFGLGLAGSARNIFFFLG